tara:strand:+ start:337 stop:723 length:387 start_codon:yes stop_codon:yes gene_type:complete
MKIPSVYDYGEFSRSERKGIFNRKRNSRDFRFKFLKFEKSRSVSLKRNSIFLVVQSWLNKGNEKVLYSGLKKVNPYCYYGDNIRDKKKDFFVLIVERKDLIKMYYFPNFLPRKKLEFSSLLYSQETII